MTSAKPHVCAKCGKPLNPVNWRTAGVTDRFGGQTFKLCDTCGEAIGIILEWVVLKDKEVRDD